MKVCQECFKDEELRKEVQNESSEVGVCDVCGTRGPVVDLDHFADFFQDVLELFSKAPNAQFTVLEIVQNNWGIFSSVKSGEKILNEIISNAGIGISLSDKVDYTASLQKKIDIWKEIKEKLKTQFRFFIDCDELDRTNFIEPVLNIPKGTLLYRARIPESGKKRITSQKMSCPPKDKATAGRANPVGIPYLYLCHDINTTFYEVRAGFLDKVCVGQFEVVRDLKIVDFDFAFPLYPSYIDDDMDHWHNKVVKFEVLKEIRKDLSKPLTRYDTELEYVPTQWICEYCKMIGADGISFASSLDKNGINYVLFNQDDAKCRRVKSRTIEEITIKAKK